MRTFGVPKTAILELPDHRKVDVRLTGIAPTGLWVEGDALGDVPFRASLRVAFPAPEGEIGIRAEVVCHGPSGLGLELPSNASTAARDIFADWSAGRATSLPPGQPLILPTGDLPPPRRKSAARIEAPTEPPPRKSSPKIELAPELPPRKSSPKIELAPEPPPRKSSPKIEAPSVTHLPAMRGAATEPERRSVPPSESGPGTHELMRIGRRRNQLSGKTILVIEDDTGAARLLQIGLSRHGGKVHVAQDGLAGLDTFGARAVNVVLLDWMLPHMPGYRVLAEMRKRDPKIPIAVVSGMVTSGAMRSEVRKLGADEVFAKPYELIRISDWIARVLDGSGERIEGRDGSRPAGEHAAR